MDPSELELMQFVSGKRYYRRGFGTSRGGVMDFWEVNVRFERRCLSVLGRFLPANFRCLYNLTKVAQDCLLCKIPLFYKCLNNF